MSLKATVVVVTPFRQNCLIVWDDAGGPATVVDPGGDVSHILATIDAEGLSVGQIVLTHGHLDHVGGVAELRDALLTRGGAVAVIGPDERDAFLIAGLVDQARAFGVTGAGAFTPDRWLAEGETVTMGGTAFDVLHCPGHTPGSIVLVSKSVGFAIVGDVLFQGSVGRTDFPYGDTTALLGSIHEKLLPLGDDISFACGHGPGSTFGAERTSNPYLRPGAI